MGSGIRISCYNCGKYDVTLLTGIGFMYSPNAFKNPPSIKPNLWNVVKDKKILKDVEMLITEKKAKIFDDEIFDEKINYGMKIYYSEKEKRIYNLFDFSLSYLEDGIQKIYRAKYYDKYGELLRKINKEELFNLEIKCPKCGEEISGFFIKEYIMWD